MSKDAGPLDSLFDPDRSRRPAPVESPTTNPAGLPLLPSGTGTGTGTGPGRGSDRRSRRATWTLATAATGLVVALGAGLVLATRDSGRVPVAAPPATTAAPVAAATAPAPAPSPAQTHAPSRARLAVDATFVSAGPKPSMPWPDSGQARVTVPGIGELGHSGSSRAVPIASITKVMTAYTILRDHPLGSGPGPTITVSAAEAALYPEQKANGESVVLVEAGEKISLRDALEGLLIASGDNLADILARWDAGSVSAFVGRMNANAARLGMGSTHFADASGLSARSVSTASDLLKLAPVVMAKPALARMVGTSEARIPLNDISNVNTLLGVHGVIGIKTGTTTAAGGCMLFAATTEVSGRTRTIYGVVLGVTGERSRLHSNARDAADALVVRAQESLHPIILLRAGRTVATVYDRKGREVRLTVEKTVKVTGWSGQKFRFTLPRTRIGRVPDHVTVHTPTGTTKVGLVEEA